MEIVRKIANAGVWENMENMTQGWDCKEHISTKERIAVFYDTMDDVQLSEFDWGKPQGKEIW